LLRVEEKETLLLYGWKKVLISVINKILEVLRFMKKKYLVTCINFGKPDNPARVLIEEYLKRNSKQKLSAFIRRLVIIFLSDDPRFKYWKTQLLLTRRREVGKKLSELVELKEKIEKKLLDRGIDLEDIYEGGK